MKTKSLKQFHQAVSYIKFYVGCLPQLSNPLNEPTLKLLSEISKKKKIKWSRYRPSVTQRAGRGIALLFNNRGTRRGRVISSTPRPHFTPGKDPVPILQEAGWASGPFWMGGKSRPHRDSIPDGPVRRSVAKPTELPGPLSEASSHLNQWRSALLSWHLKFHHPAKWNSLKNKATKQFSQTSELRNF